LSASFLKNNYFFHIFLGLIVNPTVLKKSASSRQQQSKMKTAIIIGGSGLTGKKLTRSLLADKRYGSVRAFVRKPINIIHEKLNQEILDFNNPSPTLFRGDELFCCLGTTIREAGGKEAFLKVDHGYVITMAQLAFEQGIKKVCAISSIGADSNSFFFYNRVKGKMERDLMKIGFEKCIIMRPALLLGLRKKSRWGEQVTAALMTTFSVFIPKKYKPIQSEDVALAMIKLMNNDDITGNRIAESDEIRLVAKRPK
jgi:uncharacterized protein YbjT (DUF2867 family)